MAKFRFESSFAGIRIDVLSSNTDHGRRVFPHEFPQKDGASTQDQGRRPRRVDLEFIFIDRKAQPGEELPVGDYQRRFEQFDELVENESVRTLVHPYMGQILCRIENFRHNGDGEGQPRISCSASFIEDIDEPPVNEAVGGAIQSTAGSQAVLAAAVNVDDTLFAVGLSSTLPGLSIELAISWENSLDLTTRQVQTEMANFNGRLNTELGTLNDAADPDFTPVIQAYTLLQFRLTRAAEAFSTSTPRVIEITTEELIPLRIIAAEFYGADEADRRFLEMLELNPQIRTPACVEPARVLKAYSRTVQPRTLRRQ